MDPELAKKYGGQLERICWILSIFAMLTQIGRFSFPSYNVVLGFWGVYSAFTKHGRAAFGFITFSFLSLILDIIFCSLNASEEKFAQYTFALVMFIFCMFIKVGGIYTGAHFFSSIGGAYAMENDFNNAYEGLATNANSGMDSSGTMASQQQPVSGGGGYYPQGMSNNSNNMGMSDGMGGDSRGHGGHGMMGNSGNHDDGAL